MAKTPIGIMCSKDADKAAVVRLVELYATELVTRVDLNRRDRGVSRSVVHTDGYVLACYDKQAANEQLASMGKQTNAPYFVLACLAESQSR